MSVQCQRNGKTSSSSAGLVTAGAPVKLLELVFQMQDADKDGVATDLAQNASDLIASAWNGSMCEGKLGRKIPLADAIRRSTAVLDAAFTELLRWGEQTSWNQALEKKSQVSFKVNYCPTRIYTFSFM